MRTVIKTCGTQVLMLIVQCHAARWLVLLLAPVTYAWIFTSVQWKQTWAKRHYLLITTKSSFTVNQFSEVSKMSLLPFYCWKKKVCFFSTCETFRKQQEREKILLCLAIPTAEMKPMTLNWLKMKKVERMQVGVNLASKLPQTKGTEITEVLVRINISGDHLDENRRGGKEGIDPIQPWEQKVSTLQETEVVQLGRWKTCEGCICFQFLEYDAWGKQRQHDSDSGLHHRHGTVPWPAD